MKKSSWLLTAIGPALVVILAAKPATDHQKYISVEQASNAGSIHMDILGKGGYSGFCLKMAIYNASADSGYYHLEAGRRLHSNDTGTQDILVTRDIFIEIAGKQEEHFFLYGFCSNMHRHAPDKESTYGVGHMADKKLLALAQYISKTDSAHHSPYNLNTIQDAVWAISDNASIDGIRMGCKDSVAAAKLAEMVEHINSMYAVKKHRRIHHKNNTEKVESAQWITPSNRKTGTNCQFEY